jgi:hypothetical protein
LQRVCFVPILLKKSLFADTMQFFPRRRLRSLRGTRNPRPQTPRDIVQTLSQVVSKALETSEFRARLAALAVELLPMGPQEFDALLREESRSAAEFFGSAEPKQ